MSPQDIPNSSSPTPRINLGGDPGTLIATLPALMGFTPSESLILVGLYNAGQDRRAMRIGPVVRTDLHGDSLARGLATFTDAMQNLDTPEAVLIGVCDDMDLLDDIRLSVENLLLSDNIGINGVHFTDKIAAGEKWYHPTGAVGGVIGDVADNPLRVMAKCTGAVQLETREERDAWLDPVSPRLTSTPGLRSADPELFVHQASEFITLLGEVINEIESGQATVEEVAQDESVLHGIARLCMDDHVHPVIVLFAQGTVNPAVRELLAVLARRTRGSARCRVMLVLALILSSNDEGSLAFHTLARVQDELSQLPKELSVGDENTRSMAETISKLHHSGEVRWGIRSILVSALEVLVYLNAEGINGASEYCFHEDCDEEWCDGECCECVSCNFHAFGDYEQIRRQEDFGSREQMMDWYVERALFCFHKVIRPESLDRALDALEWPAIDRALAT